MTWSVGLLLFCCCFLCRQLQTCLVTSVNDLQIETCETVHAWRNSATFDQVKLTWFESIQLKIVIKKSGIKCYEKVRCKVFFFPQMYFLLYLQSQQITWYICKCTYLSLHLVLSVSYKIQKIFDFILVRIGIKIGNTNKW